MENQDIINQLEKNSLALEGQRKTISSVVGLLERISSAVDEGFEKVNERLSVLEGKQGMQGVNSQLTDIKHELHKIQKAYPYEEVFNNMKSIQGEA